jgi:hypothetical protein
LYRINQKCFYKKNLLSNKKKQKMKKIINYLALALALHSTVANAQAPQAMNYQGIARSVQGNALANT